MKCYSCSHMGVSGSTNIFVRKVQSESEQKEEIWEARVGIAIMGYTNNDRRVSNPFDCNYRDNYAQGFGTSESKALNALKKEIEDIASSLWV